MICPMCGNILDDSDKACGSCGWSDLNSNSACESAVGDTDLNFQNLFSEKPKRKKPSFVVSLGGFVMTCILMWFFLALCINLCVEKITSRENIKEIISETNFSSEFIWSEELVDDDTTFGDAIVNELSENVDEQKAREIVEVLELDDFLDGMFSDVFTGLLSGEGIPQIQVDTIIDNIEEHREQIEKITGQKLDDQTIEQARESLEELGDDLNEGFEQINEEYQSENDNELLKVLGVFKYTVYAFEIIILVFVVLLIFMYKKSQSGVYRATRCVAIASGNAFAMMYLFVKLFDIIVQETNADETLAGDLAYKLLNGVISLISSTVSTIGIIFAIFVVASIILYIYYRKNTEKY